VVRTRSVRGSDLAANGWAQRFDIFLKLSKPTQTWKLKMDTLLCSKNSQIWHASRLGHYEQLSELFQHPNLKRCRVKIPGTDSQFEFLVNFQRGLILLENLINSPKILLDIDFTKVNLVGITCM
jgi:hypothetical protein